MVEVLSTPRLRLRELEEHDLDFLAELLGDAEVMRYYPHTYSREEARSWLERQRRRYREDGCGLWLAERRTDGAPLAHVGVVRQTVEGETHLEVGYLVARSHWRQGIATEAASACRDHAMGVLGADHVIALVRPENAPSRGVARKLGMQAVRRVAWAGFPHDLYRVERGAPRGASLDLVALSGRFCVVGLDAGAPVPAWAGGVELFAITRTKDELSIVCDETLAPRDVRAERGFRALRVGGTLDFSSTGVLSSLTRPLADARISVFALSTYDTDYLLVREVDFERAVAALASAGHRVEVP